MGFCPTLVKMCLWGLPSGDNPINLLWPRTISNLRMSICLAPLMGAWTIRPQKFRPRTFRPQTFRPRKMPKVDVSAITINCAWVMELSIILNDFISLQDNLPQFCASLLPFKSISIIKIQHNRKYLKREIHCI